MSRNWIFLNTALVSGAVNELMEFSATDNCSMFGQSRAMCNKLFQLRILHRRKLIFFKCRKSGSKTDISSSSGNRNRFRLKCSLKEKETIEWWKSLTLSYGLYYVRSRNSNFGNCLTISATIFHVGIRDAVKSKTKRLANGLKLPAQLMLEFGRETVVSSFRWLLKEKAKYWKSII